MGSPETVALKMARFMPMLGASRFDLNQPADHMAGFLAAQRRTPRQIPIVLLERERWGPGNVPQATRR